jgi:hypothetical protein
VSNSKNGSTFLQTYWPLFVGIGLTAGAFIFYVAVFGFELSHKQSTWADLGNYLAGVVGPLLGLLTIFLVLETLRVQREELALSREELRKSSEALERQANQFAAKDHKDDLLAKAQIIFNEVGRQRGEQIHAIYTHRTPERAKQISGIAGELSTGGQSVDDMFKQPTVAEEMFFGDDPRAGGMVNGLRPLVSLLDELATILEEVDSLSHSATTTNYYRRRLQELVRQLCEKRYITNELMGQFDSRK